MRRAVTLLGLTAAACAALVAYLRRTTAVLRAPVAQAELERAVAAVDRELAVNLELLGMFDQTKQAFVLENGQYLAHRQTLERCAPAVFAMTAALYARVPEAEGAMERRGPAGSIREADRALVEEWEGDAREAQRLLRGALARPRMSRWGAIRWRVLRRRTGG